MAFADGRLRLVHSSEGPTVCRLSRVWMEHRRAGLDREVDVTNPAHRVKSLTTAAMLFVAALSFLQFHHVARLKAQTRFQPVALWLSDEDYNTRIDLVNWSAAPATAQLILYDQSA